MSVHSHKILVKDSVAAKGSEISKISYKITTESWCYCQTTTLSFLTLRQTPMLNAFWRLLPDTDVKPPGVTARHRCEAPWCYCHKSMTKKIDNESRAKLCNTYFSLRIPIRMLHYQY